MNALLTSRVLVGSLAAALSLVAVPAMAQPTSKPADKPAATQPDKHDSKKDTKEARKEAKQEGKQEKKDEKKGATGVKVGEKAPDFRLTDTDGKEVSLAALTRDKKIVVVEWFNPRCPFVLKHHKTFNTMVETYNKYKDKNVVWVAINSGAAGAEGAGKDATAAARKDFKIDYPILIDESGKVGMAYGAKRTPEMFVIDTTGTVVYHGAIDDDNSPSTLGKTNHVDAALKSLLAGETIKNPTTNPYGCHIGYADKK
jgi:peroxiredoxin